MKNKKAIEISFEMVIWVLALFVLFIFVLAILPKFSIVSGIYDAGCNMGIKFMCKDKGEGTITPPVINDKNQKFISLDEAKEVCSRENDNIGWSTYDPYFIKRNEKYNFAIDDYDNYLEYKNELIIAECVYFNLKRFWNKINGFLDVKYNDPTKFDSAFNDCLNDKSFTNINQDKVIEIIKKAPDQARENFYYREKTLISYVDCVIEKTGLKKTLEDPFSDFENKGYNVNLLKAIIEIESKGSAFDSQLHATVRFECHVFNRNIDLKIQSLGDPTGDLARKKVPCTIDPGKTFSTNPLETNKQAFLHALNIDRAIAISSTSFGIGQIMGFNYKEAGFNNLDDFYKAMNTSEEEQIRAMINFILSKPGLAAEFKSENPRFEYIARVYNGEKYIENDYHTKLNVAYNRILSQSDS
jgi:hypothetical protein